MTVAGHRLSARFLGEPGNRLMVVHFSPVAEARAHVVYLPPFGEEMNRCRALVAAQARRFARAGYLCSVLDFYGTGDSEGRLYEANFDIWKANVHLLVDTLLREQRLPVVLWGLRLGAVLALEYAAESPVQDILLWAPITSGKRYVTQLLRQRVASLVGKDLPPETTDEIRQRLEAGHNVEISGYVVGRTLVADMEQTAPYRESRYCTGRLYWLENIGEPGQTLSAGSARAVEKLQQHNTVEVKLFSDPPLWQLHKRDAAPELMQITGSLLT